MKSKNYSVRRKLTHVSQYVLNELTATNKPVFSVFELFNLISKARLKAKELKLSLRQDQSLSSDFKRTLANLKASGQIKDDQDYSKSAMLRNVSVPDLPAEDIVCLADPTAYVSHLSAMQRWGLTDRSPYALMVTQLDRASANISFAEVMASANLDMVPKSAALKFVKHPEQVRGRPVKVLISRVVGDFRLSRETYTRVATRGQTFLDMVQEPDFCGGMNHVIEVWEEHAASDLQDIVNVIDRKGNSLAKSRAGHILTERLGFSHFIVESWKKTCKAGIGRKLDPSKESSPNFSKPWNLSINV
jgi:predicted transcriptional regulator of viral defense system